MQNALKKTAFELVPNIEDTVKEYTRLKAQAAELEVVMKRLRNVIEVALTAEPDRQAVIAGVRLNLIDVERDNFALKKAIEKLGTELLSPFITTTKYSMLKVAVAGGKDE